MSHTCQDRTAAAPAEASNRVQLGLSNRLLARPEIGALVAAIVIFIFFLIVAPAFRTPAVVLHRPLPVLDHRHRRRRCRHADDRRRVRPVRRCPRRPPPACVNAHVLLPARHQPVGRRGPLAGLLPGASASSTATW